MDDFRFPKSERMTHKRDIELVFASGSTIKKTPVLLKYCWKTDATEGVKVLIVAPKRQHRNAVTRNKLKRRMRELFRLHKSSLKILTTGANKTLLLAVIYQGNASVPFKQLETQYRAAIMLLQAPK